MKKEKSSLCGSNQMIFCYPHHNFKITAIKCGAKRQIHEATMVFTKKHWRAMGGFEKNSQGEGAKMVDFHSENKISLTQIVDCLCCIAHKQNTVDKEQFKEASDITDDVVFNPNDVQLIKSILKID